MVSPRGRGFAATTPENYLRERTALPLRAWQPATLKA
jgi:hypothetical protein